MGTGDDKQGGGGWLEKYNRFVVVVYHVLIVYGLVLASWLVLDMIDLFLDLNQRDGGRNDVIPDFPSVSRFLLWHAPIVVYLGLLLVQCLAKDRRRRRAREDREKE